MNLDNNICLFYDMLSVTSFSKFAEVGVYLGNSILYLAKMNHHKAGFRVYAVDLWDKLQGNTNGENLQQQSYEIYKNNVTESGFRDYITDINKSSVDASLGFENNSLDCVFIDAAHDYNSVIEDIACWKSKVRSGGIIAGHDYGEPCGVADAVHNSFNDKEINLIGSVWWVIV